MACSSSRVYSPPRQSLERFWGNSNRVALAPAAYEFGRLAAHHFMNIFAAKMAAVFMSSTCTIALRTSIFSRWVAYSGFTCWLILLLHHHELAVDYTAVFVLGISSQRLHFDF